MKKERKTAVWALFAAAAGALLLFLLFRGKEPPPSQPEVAPVEPAAAAEPYRFSPPAPAPTGEGPIIDKILVDQQEVCEGEENLVTVRAHASDPKETVHLTAIIDGHEGMVVPVIARIPKDGSEWPKVVVMDRQKRVAEADVPFFTVRPCKPERRMEIVYGLRQNTPAEYELEARIINVKASEPFVGASYFWDFGDGNTETTSTPFVVHDYSRRPQLSSKSYMLVRVEARSTTDELVLGHRSIRLINTEYENLENAGIVTLVVQLNPRFPQLDSDGGVTQGVTLWHHSPTPVTITRVQARRNFTLPGVAPQVRDVGVKSVLGTNVIPPAGISFKVRLDRSHEKDVFSIDYLLDGHTADGKPVQSVFSVMAPPPAPTAENHIPVTDPTLHQKIVRAREILGKEFVTDEDFAELNRRGIEGFKPADPIERSEGPPAYPR